MEFFLEMVVTAVVALLFSFVVAKLVSVAAAGGGDGSSSVSEEKSGIHDGEDVFVEELLFGQKMEAQVLGSERNVGIVEENVEYVDRFVREAVRLDELDDAAKGSREIGAEITVSAVQAWEAESAIAVSPEEMVPKEILVRGQAVREAESDSAVSLENMKAEETSVPGQVQQESETGAAVSQGDVITADIAVREQEEGKSETGGAVSQEKVIAEEMDVGGEEERKSESGGAVSPANVVVEESTVRGHEEGSESAKERSDHVEVEESEDVAVTDSEVRVEGSESKEGIQEKTEELNIEEEGGGDDDWEGIEKTELEKAFAAAAKFVEESGDALEMGNETKTELHGLHKIATEGPCRDSPPMALLVSARAKCVVDNCYVRASDEQGCLHCARNAWQKLGNMSQEDAMEQYLALVSKEIPGQFHAGYSLKPETEISVVLPPDMGVLELPAPLSTTDSKHEAIEGEINEASNSDNKGKIDASI